MVNYGYNVHNGWSTLTTHLYLGKTISYWAGKLGQFINIDLPLMIFDGWA